jgi:uncharacterized membrane protein
LERSDRSFTGIHLSFLFAVTVMPFSTKLLAEFITYRVAPLAYWLNILLLGRPVVMRLELRGCFGAAEA